MDMDMGLQPLSHRVAASITCGKSAAHKSDLRSDSSAAAAACENADSIVCDGGGGGGRSAASHSAAPRYSLTNSALV